MDTRCGEFHESYPDWHDVKCDTCCGSVSIVAASGMMAAFSIGRLASLAAEGRAALPRRADLYDGDAPLFLKSMFHTDPVANVNGP